MFHYEGSFPIKIECQIKTLDQIDEEARMYEEAYFNNEPVPQDNSELVWIPNDRRDEFFERYNHLLQEFQEDASRLANQLNKH